MTNPLRFWRSLRFRGWLGLGLLGLLLYPALVIFFSPERDYWYHDVQLWLNIISTGCLFIVAFILYDGWERISKVEATMRNATQMAREGLDGMIDDFNRIIESIRLSDESWVTNPPNHLQKTRWNEIVELMDLAIATDRGVWEDRIPTLLNYSLNSAISYREELMRLTDYYSVEFTWGVGRLIQDLEFSLSRIENKERRLAESVAALLRLGLNLWNLENAHRKFHGLKPIKHADFR